MPAHKTQRFNTKAVAHIRQCMQMIGPGSTEADQIGTLPFFQPLNQPMKFEPLVTADIGVKLIEPEHSHLNFPLQQEPGIKRCDRDHFP